MSLLFEDLFKRLNTDLKRQADNMLSKANRATQVPLGCMGLHGHMGVHGVPSCGPLPVPQRLVPPPLWCMGPAFLFFPWVGPVADPWPLYSLIGAVLGTLCLCPHALPGTGSTGFGVRIFL